MTDITLPGTHDTLTYDLSTQVSAGGWDDEDDLSLFLHDIFIIPGHPLGVFIRSLAQCHGLSIADQLDNGIRYIDFRMMREPDTKVCISILDFIRIIIVY